MGISLRAGRLFDGSDRADSTEISVIINEALAAKYFPGENPTRPPHGRRLQPQAAYRRRRGKRRRGNAEARAGTDALLSRAAGALVREPGVARDPHHAARGRRRRFSTRRAAPCSAWRRAMPIAGTTTMQRVFDTAVGPARQIMSLLTLLSGLALILGGVRDLRRDLALRGAPSARLGDPRRARPSRVRRRGAHRSTGARRSRSSASPAARSARSRSPACSRRFSSA